MYSKPNTDEEKEESMDLYHSIETLFRIWERQGVDMDAESYRVLKATGRL
jgi:hypothetical protein